MSTENAATTPAARLFTPADDVELAQFEYGDVGSPPGGLIKFSPDGREFVLVTERGQLNLNAPQDTIWLFNTRDVRDFLRSGARVASAPLSLVQLASERDGPIIQQVRWLADSTAVAFIAPKRSEQYEYHQLFIADVLTQTIRALTPEDQDVETFDIRDATHFVYQVRAATLLNSHTANDSPATVLTGKDLFEVLFPDEDRRMTPFSQAGLWAVVGGDRFQVLDAHTHLPVTDGTEYSLSPNGTTLVMLAHVEQVPPSWVRYHAPPGYEGLHIPVDPNAYFLLDLRSGERKLLVDAPSGLNQDWHSYLLTARWSPDGQSLILPDTFLPLATEDPKEIAERERNPYIAVLRLQNAALSPILAIRAGLDPKRYAVEDARFIDDHTVVIDFDRSYFLVDAAHAAIFHEGTRGTWLQVPGSEDPRLAALPIKVFKRESVDEPPVIVAESRVNHQTRTLWDPNPELKGIALAKGEVIQGRDSSGYEWEAGFLKPVHYIPGQRYALVIQTHGFSKRQFLSNGVFSTAFAAQALAARGIAVVQIGWNPHKISTPSECPGEVLLYRSVVQKLADAGIVDARKVGAIGFSRSVYHVLCALTATDSPLSAASVTDGTNFGYFEYLTAPSRDDERVNGGKPFGTEGLKHWFSRSPGFNLDRVRGPLLLPLSGPEAVLEDWEPYAGLRALEKPVDLIMLQPGSHVMSNPVQRLTVETLNVDWFDFWLNGHEDRQPGKEEQYVRWRNMRSTWDRSGASERADKEH